MELPIAEPERLELSLEPWGSEEARQAPALAEERAAHRPRQVREAEPDGVGDGTDTPRWLVPRAYSRM
jgi:hypothetical protein